LDKYPANEVKNNVYSKQIHTQNLNFEHVKLAMKNYRFKEEEEEHNEQVDMSPQDPTDSKVPAPSDYTKMDSLPKEISPQKSNVPSVSSYDELRVIYLRKINQSPV